jgi:signal peptidase I
MRIRSLAWALLAVLAVSLAAGAAVAWHEGYRLYAVRTGSMAPTYPTGALLVDGPVQAPPAIGDVVTFRTRDGLVTHRVHDTTAQGLKTKGDANRTPDAWTVPPRNVIGTVVAGIPAAGYLLVFFQQPTGVPSMMVLLVSLVLAWSIFFGPTTTAATQPRLEADSDDDAADESDWSILEPLAVYGEPDVEVEPQGVGVLG